MPETEDFSAHQVPVKVDEQAFRTEVLRTLREVGRKVDGIVERLHAGDLRLAEHAQRLEQQEARHEADLEMLKETSRLQGKRIEDLGVSLQAEKDRNLETRTKFGVVWAALAAVATLAGTTLWALVTSKGSP